MRDNAELSISRDESGEGARRESFVFSIDTMETRLSSGIVDPSRFSYHLLWIVIEREIFIQRMIK